MEGIRVFNYRQWGKESDLFFIVGFWLFYSPSHWEAFRGWFGLRRIPINADSDLIIKSEITKQFSSSSVWLKIDFFLIFIVYLYNMIIQIVVWRFTIPVFV